MADSATTRARGVRSNDCLIDIERAILNREMEKTPFANRFAMLRDKFGTSWMLLHQPLSA